MAEELPHWKVLLLRTHSTPLRGDSQKTGDERTNGVVALLRSEFLDRYGAELSVQ